jgi:hypothetical protein
LPLAKLLVLLAAMLSLVAPANVYGAASLLTPENRRDLELQPGVVLIIVSFHATLGPFQCDPVVSGTGFLYRPDGYLITNGHVVQRAMKDNDAAKLVREQTAIPCLKDDAVRKSMQQAGRRLTDEEMGNLARGLAQFIEEHRLQIGDESLTVYLENSTATGTKYPGEIKEYSGPGREGKDVAIVKINGSNLPTVEFGNSDEVSVGDQMTVVGYPGSATNATLSGAFSLASLMVPTVTNGRISAINKTGNDGTPVLQSEATINPGNSGGPAFDSNGHVIGIATYMLTDASNLNFFVPVNTAMEFVRQAGAAPQRGVFDRQWHDALDAYVSRHWTEAHDRMVTVLETMPRQPDAEKLRDKAKINESEEGIVGRLGLPTVIGSAVALLLIASIAFALSVKRKPQPVSPAVTGQSPETMPVGVQANARPAVIDQQKAFGTLQVTTGPLAGNRFAIPKSGLLIGRDPARCAVVLTGDSVGREHAWVVPLDNGVVVIDRDSTNGTYVNSTESPRISKIALKDGDRIFIGQKNPTAITYFSS